MKDLFMNIIGGAIGGVLATILYDIFKNTTKENRDAFLYKIPLFGTIQLKLTIIWIKRKKKKGRELTTMEKILILPKETYHKKDSE